MCKNLVFYIPQNPKTPKPQNPTKKQILNNYKFILFEFSKQTMLPQKKLAPQFKAGYNVQSRVRMDDKMAGYNDYAQR